MMGDSVILILREALPTHFSELELIALCREFNVEYDELQGEGFYAKTRAVIAVIRDRNKLDQFVARIHELRPDVYMSTGLAKSVVHNRLVTRINETTQRKASRERSRRNFSRMSALSAVAALAVMGYAAVKNVAEPTNPQPEQLAAAPAQSAPIEAPSAEARAPKIAIPISPDELDANKDMPAHSGPAIVINVPAAQPIGAVALSPLQNSQFGALNAAMFDAFIGMTDREKLANWSPDARAALNAFDRVSTFSITGFSRSDKMTVRRSNMTETRVMKSSGSASILSTRQLFVFTSANAGKKVCESADFTYEIVWREEGDPLVKSFSWDNIRHDCP